LNRLANAWIDRAAAFVARVLHFHLIGWHLAIAAARQSNEHDPIGYRPDEPSFVAAILNSTLLHFTIPQVIEIRHKKLTSIVKQVTAWAAGADIRPDEIVHSGKLRAEQTAEILADYLMPAKGTTVRRGLARHSGQDDWFADLVRVRIGRPRAAVFAEKPLGRSRNFGPHIETQAVPRHLVGRVVGGSVQRFDHMVERLHWPHCGISSSEDNRNSVGG
jgi:hypothetical protein